jgi:hypothetical protein
MIDEFRRSRRRKVAEEVIVVDTMVDSVIGRLANVSETGMLLMASTPLVEDALYQFRFNLNDARGRENTIEVGAHLLWQDATHASGQRWTGFRFITVPEEHMLQLRDWIDGPGAQYV